MPIPARFRRRPIAAAIAASALLGAIALGAPSSASAYYQQYFCQNVWMPSGTNCKASNRHTLQTVNGWTINSVDRICAASFTSAWGYQNSDWRCDYEYVQKILGGRVQGVGAIHNGDPQGFHGYGMQEF